MRYADPISMAQCSKCKEEIAPGSGSEATIDLGEALCRPCYFGAWMPATRVVPPPVTEEKLPPSQPPPAKRLAA
jgi:hypothetical protein